MLWQDIQRIRNEAPLVHNITNFVVMNITANALLALGASPVMAHALEEVKDMVAICRSLVLNMGTLSPEWISAMLMAGAKARDLGIPIVFDPVGSGATPYRTDSALRIIHAVQPSIIRGNASEIRSLVGSKGETKGVDSIASPEAVADEAFHLSEQYGAVVSVSGPVDLVLQGTDVHWVRHGHPIMTRVTGMGCVSTAITGAFAAVNPNLLEAAVHAMTVMGIVGESAQRKSGGPGTFVPQFLDDLSKFEGDQPEVNDSSNRR